MLSLHQVDKSFGRHMAVDGLSLTLAEGEVFGLLGPNGAGKTSTLHMAVGLTQPDRGSVELRGVGDPSKAKVRARIGYAPQALCMYDELTGRENISLMAGLYGLRGKERERQTDWALEFVSLRARERDRVAGYSVGMKRRLTLASAIVHKPVLLVLDEPTAGVDPQSRRAIFEGVRALREELALTVLYTTHALEEAELLCDRVAIMDRGRIVMQGSVSDLLQRAGQSLDGSDALREDAIATRGHATLAPQRLEQLFLELTGRELRDT